MIRLAIDELLPLTLNGASPSSTSRPSTVATITASNDLRPS